MKQAQGGGGIWGKVSDQPQAQGGFLKEVMPELSLEKGVGIHQMGEGIRDVVQVEWHVRRLRGIRFYRKSLNAPGCEAGEVWGVDGERLAKAFEVMGGAWALSRR